MIAPRIAQLPELLRSLTIRGILTECLESTELPRPHQALVDGTVRGLLKGEDPRVILDTRESRAGLKADLAREAAAAYEVARLVHGGLDRVDAIYQVAEVFSVSVRTVERWCHDHDDRAVDVPRYIADLKAAGLLRD